MREPAPPAAVLDDVACLDADHDGRGVGCARGADCDDGDPLRAALVGGAEDADGDGVPGAFLRLDCGGGVAAGDLVPLGEAVDCDDSDVDVTTGCAHACVTVTSGGGPTTWCPDARAYQSANDTCQQRFTVNLVSIHDQDDEDRAAALVLRDGNDLSWIGLDDQDSEGTFVFADRSVFDPGSFSAFRPGEPNDGLSQHNEDCVLMESGGWDDKGCGGSFAYVCR